MRDILFALPYASVSRIVQQTKKQNFTNTLEQLYNTLSYFTVAFSSFYSNLFYFGFLVSDSFGKVRRLLSFANEKRKKLVILKLSDYVKDRVY